MTRAPTARQQRDDVLVGLLVAGATVGSLLLVLSIQDVEGAAPTGEAVAWCLAVALPLCVRRRWPTAVLLTCSALFIGLQARMVPESTVTSIVLFLALYTAGAWGGDRRLATAARGVVVVVMFCWLVYALSSTAWAEHLAGDGDGDGPLPDRTAAAAYSFAYNVVFFAAAWVFGDRAWRQERQRLELAERNAELRRERDENARRAVVEERVRIARELHDVVAHHVSVMGVQAGAARMVLDDDPDRSKETLVAVEAQARTAMTEMRRLLGVLRAEDGEEPRPTGPQPGLAALPEIVDQAAAAGLDARWTEVGEPRPVPASVGVTLYRVTQEAVTNTLRHAGARRIDVRLRHLGEAVEVEIIDDGRSAGGAAGLGQRGMRERVALHDGDLEMGPRPGGGYRVRARVPLEQA